MASELYQCKSCDKRDFYDPVFDGELSINSFGNAKSFVDKAILNSFNSSYLWQELSSDSSAIYTGIKDFILFDGKRLRPILFYLFYRAFTPVVDLGKAEKTMAAMEVIHSFILIHDDIIDKSENRRSKQTLHCTFNSLLAQGNNHSPLNGEDLALVAGDMLYAFAVDILNQAGFEPSLMSKIMGKLSETAMMTAHGEFKEILETLKEPKNITEETILRIYDLKTSYYTFFGPAVIASTIANSDTDEALIEEFSLALGKAFQIHNDLKELKESDITLKIPKDFLEKKRTLVLLWAYHASNELERAKIDRFLKTKDISFNDFLEIKQIFIDRKIFEKAQKKIEELTKKALTTIMTLKADQEYLNFIKSYIQEILK